MRLLSASLVALLAVASVATPAGGQSDAEAGRQAAREIAAARQRADEAAAAYDAASMELAGIEADIVNTRAQHGEAEARLGALGASVRDVVVRQYVNSSGPAVVLPIGGDLGASVRAEALVRFVTVGQTDAIDQYSSLSEDLRRAEARLAEREGAQRDAAVALEDRAGDLQAELIRLQEVEAARQAEVRRQEEIRRRAAEEAARQAAAAAAARAAEQAALLRRQQQAARPQAPTAGSTPTTSAPAGSTPTTSPRAPTTPSAPGGGPYAIVCPVAGAVAFGDTWGAARSGGRRHQGTDMMAARGTPVVAPVAGTVTLRSVSLGGLSFFVAGVDGHTYFGTHLNGYEGASGRRVSAGEVIGYVGNTGNASGGATHLHFEIKPRGGPSVNPYTSLRAAC